MKKILIVIGTYLPGYKAGGPVTSVANLVEYLGREYEFYILTSCRDLGEQIPYSDIKIEDWNTVGNARVYYCGEFAQDLIERLAKGMDIIYVCGCFNAYGRNVLKLKRDGRICGRVIVASMGLFSEGAFRIKYAKKKLYMILTNLLGLYRGIEWSASTHEEAQNIAGHVWGNMNVHIATDLPRTVAVRSVDKHKQVNELQVVFVSRISRKKNLSYALQVLQNITDIRIHFTIIGVMEDEQYWQECKNIISELPENVIVSYHGAIPSSQVVEALEQYQLFLFPTLGENYGHVIQEALSAGCVALISDQTPWQDLDQSGVGAVIPLDQSEQYVERLRYYAAMDENEFQKISDRAIQYAYDHSNIEEMADRYREMFGAATKIPSRQAPQIGRK